MSARRSSRWRALAARAVAGALGARPREQPRRTTGRDPRRSPLTAGLSFVTSGRHRDLAPARQPHRAAPGPRPDSPGCSARSTRPNNDWVFTARVPRQQPRVRRPFAHLLLAFPSGSADPRATGLVVATYALVTVRRRCAPLLVGETDRVCGNECPDSTIALEPRRPADGSHRALVISVTAVALVVGDPRHRSPGAGARRRPRCAGRSARSSRRARSCCSCSRSRLVDERVLRGSGPAARARRRSSRSGRCRSRSCSACCAHGSPARRSATCCSRSAAARRSATRSPGRCTTRRSTSPTGCRSAELLRLADGNEFRDERRRRAREATSSGTGGRSPRCCTTPLLDDEPELVDAVAAAAGLWLENERLQAELRAQLAFLETIVNTAPSLLCSLDTEGRIANLNDACRLASRNRRRGGAARAVLLGRVLRSRGARRGGRPLRCGRARLRAGHLRAHVRQPARRAGDDRLVGCADPRRPRARSATSSSAGSTSRSGGSASSSSRSSATSQAPSRTRSRSCSSGSTTTRRSTSMVRTPPSSRSSAGRIRRRSAAACWT